jgi:sugar O-acyltransferase (sialic acid O-acetyltransferase NeuD family)
MTSALVIFGAGGHAVSVAETVTACGFDIAAFVEPQPHTSELLGAPVLPEPPDGCTVFAIAIGGNADRFETHQNLHQTYPNSQFPALIHPSANVSRFATIGAGTVVLQGAVVGSAAVVGRFCIVNTNASIDHEGVMHDFSSLAPAATCGGRVTIGTRSTISIGAVVHQGITIGADTVLGAQSYLNVDLPSGVVAYGAPARIVRSRDDI